MSRKVNLYVVQVKLWFSVARSLAFGEYVVVKFAGIQYFGYHIYITVHTAGCLMQLGISVLVNLAKFETWQDY